VTFYRLQKGKIKLFRPSPPRNVVPLFKLPVENNRFFWILLFSEVTLFEYNVSTILLPIVAWKKFLMSGVDDFSSVI